MMKVIRKYINLIIILLLMIVASTFLLLNVSFVSEDNTHTKELKEDVLLKKYKAKAKEIKEVSKTDLIKAKKMKNELFENLPPVYKKYFNVGFNAVEDIVFYGRVIDQHNKPVSNATVNYEMSGKFLSRGSGHGSVLTDSMGNFTIDGFGAMIRVGQIKHSSIDFYHNPFHTYTTNNAQQNNTVNHVIFYNYETPSSSSSGRQSYVNLTKEAPHVFKAWRINSNSINPAIQWGRIFHGLVADGQVYTLDFEQRSKYRIKKGKHKGQLQISCKRKLLQNKMEREDKNNWEFTIDAINDGGGLQETKDYYMNHAPDTGYIKSIKIKHNANSKSYKHDIKNNRYYFRSDNGEKFGAIFFHLKPFARRKTCYFSMTMYKYNNKSRNLVIK